LVENIYLPFYPKLQLFKAMIFLVVSLGCETWSLTLREEQEMHTNYLLETLEVRDCLGHIGISGRMISNWILEKLVMKDLKVPQREMLVE
jgi:hypothetical protein